MEFFAMIGFLIMFVGNALFSLGLIFMFCCGGYGFGPLFSRGSGDTSLRVVWMIAVPLNIWFWVLLKTSSPITISVGV